MDLRTHFIRAAANAAYGFLKNVKQLERNPLVREALESAPPEAVNGRSLTDMALDDLMDRFIAIMTPLKGNENIPRSIFHWMMVERYGTGITQKESDAELYARLGAAQDGVDPKVVPEFLSAVFPVLPDQVVTSIVNYWSEVFHQVTRAVLSEDALQAHQAYVETQNSLIRNIQAMKEHRKQVTPANALAIGRKSSGGELASYANDEDGDEDDMDVVVRKAKALDLPPQVEKEVWRLVRQTKQLNPQSSEYPVNLRRLETIVSLPWGAYNDVNTDVQSAQDILDAEHYGLEKVKEKVIEAIAVQLRTGGMNGKILCLAGPPGVGKTSIAQGIAHATSRAYVKVALGGVHTESEIRGHRSTYVGAQAGRITKGLIEAASANPVMLLDEIDKMGASVSHGDPSAALLEVLDPAQNNGFRDDYTAIPFDLSKVFFICTANDLSTIPGPLRDRMEIIELSSYLQDEKYEIATRYLIPKQMKQKGLTADNLLIEPEALKKLISHHTAEAGVRKLEQKIGQICSKAVVDLMKKKSEEQIRVTPANLEDFVGPGHGGQSRIAAHDAVGVVNGLAYTSVGGTTLPIEVSLIPSRGFRLNVTGNLGKVMGESVGVAERLVRARAPQFGITDSVINSSELSVHAPEGAIPKDGPSAGAAFTTAIISTFTGIPIKRDVAMTGEINARGQVTAIGGLREKLEGALMAGVKTVLIPKQNIPHLANVPYKIRSQLAIIPVGTIEEVLQHALTRAVSPLPAPVTTPKPWTVRFREAWAVMRGSHSNDNQPAVIRRAAGTGAPGGMNGPL